MTERWRPTPSQTVGPFHGVALPWADGCYAVAEGTPGAFWITGTVRDGAGEPVADAVVETWQADPDGRFDHPDDPRGPVSRHGFRGFSRSDTAPSGEFRLLTVKPGPVPFGDGRAQAPHLDVSVFCRGLLVRLVTRIYFPDEPANADDPVLAAIPAPAARATLVAAAAPGGYRFDIHLQGERETVFFDL